MVRVCAWCQKYLGSMEPFHDPAISHGICRECVERDSLDDAPVLVVSPGRARAIPMLIGLIPLRSLKQTLFFANEVPGIVVPEAIQDRMRRASESGPDHEKAEGLAIARELAAAIAGIARGLHIMPMGRYGVVKRILEAL